MDFACVHLLDYFALCDSGYSKTDKEVSYMEKGKSGKAGKRRLGLGRNKRRVKQVRRINEENDPKLN